MSMLEVIRRVYCFLNRRRLAAELEEEMQLHADLRASDTRARQNLNEPDSKLVARRRFGRTTLHKEDAWESWNVFGLDALSRDLRLAVRYLAKNPGLLLPCAIVLALGIGVNTAAYSVADAVLLRPLPYPSPERLASIVTYAKSTSSSEISSDQDGETWNLFRSGSKSMDVAVFSDWAAVVNVSSGGRIEYVRQQRVGADFFHVLGVAPLRGRVFSREEDREGAPAVALISYSLSQRLFGEKKWKEAGEITLRGGKYQVVGVMPPGFVTAALADIWVPLQPSTRGEGAGTNYQIIARLHRGATWAQANGEAALMWAERLRTLHLAPGESQLTSLVPLQNATSAALRPTILLVWLGAAIVLLICCANVAGLLLSRALNRSRELSTRLALGGSRRDVVRQLLVESLVIGAAGGFGGVFLAQLALRFFLRKQLETSLNIWQNVTLDWRVLGVTALLTVSVTIASGLYPAFTASRTDLRCALASSGSRSVAGRRRHWLRSSLVVLEVALGFVVLVTGSLLVRSLLFLQNQGAANFDPQHVISATLPLGDVHYRTARSIDVLFRGALDRMRSSRGIESAAFGMTLPYERALYTMIGVGGDKPVNTTLTFVTPEYFSVLKTPLLYGRPFRDSDTAAAQRVAIINERFASKYLRGSEAVGRELVSGGEKLRIVGVVADLPGKDETSPDAAPVSAMPTVFLPPSQMSDGDFAMLSVWFTPSCLVRSQLPAGETFQLMQTAMKETDDQLPFSAMRSLNAVRSVILAKQQLQAVVMTTLAAIALLLAAIGLYSLLAESFAQRRREFGIRLALGSSTGNLVGEATREGFMLVIPGCLVGIIAALNIHRFLKHMIWGTAGLSGMNLAVPLLLLLSLAAVATLLPMLTLLRLNCAEILRNE